jgi:hypothetical protein
MQIQTQCWTRKPDLAQESGLFSDTGRARQAQNAFDVRVAVQERVEGPLHDGDDAQIGTSLLQQR